MSTSKKFKPTGDNDGLKENKNAPREKVFCQRNSLLVDLMNIDSIKSIYNFFIAMLIVLFMKTLICSYLNGAGLDFGVDIILKGFGKMHYVIPIWSSMFIFSMLHHVLIRLWSWKRETFQIENKRYGDIVLIYVLVTYQLCALIYSIKMISLFALPFASTVFVSCESVRFSMKTYAMGRSVGLLQFEKPLNVPTFSWYMYFMFCPSLVYRESYPRSTHTNWKLVFKHLVEIVACLFYVGFLVSHAVIEPYKTFGLKEHDAKFVVLTIFESLLPVLICHMCGFYLLLHAWQNAWAEVLKFSDKQFYLDWWNQSDYSGYYRTWNVVVHDWLFTYIYRDIILLTRSKMLAMFAVFGTSAIFHEIILSSAFGFFYPILLVMFGFFGVIFIFITRYMSQSAGNIFLWMTLLCGNGMMYSMYAMEYFARENCPIVHENIYIDYITPRSWYCHHSS